MAFALWWLPDVDGWTIRFLLVVNLALTTAGIVTGYVSGFRPILTLFFCFNYCWLAVPPVYQLSVNRGIWHDPWVYQDRAAVTQALAIVAVGCAAMLLGYLRGASPSAAGDSAPAVRQKPDTISTAETRVLLFAILGALVLLPIVAPYVGGFGGFFQSRREATQALARAGGSDVSGGLNALVRTVPGALAVVAAVLSIRRVKMAPRLVSCWMLLGASLALVLVYANPLANARYKSMTALAAIVLMLFRPSSQRSGRLVAFLAVGGLLFLYPLANVFRYAAGSDDVVSSGLSAFLTGDFDGFQQIVNSVYYVNRHGHTWGLQSLSALLIFVPRSVWPGKATPTNELVAQDRGYDFLNLSIPVQAELWVDLTFVGMVIALVAWGVLATRLDRLWHSEARWQPLVAFVAVAQIGLIRGPLSAAAGFAGLGALLLWIAARRRTQAAGADPDDPPRSNGRTASRPSSSP